MAFGGLKGTLQGGATSIGNPIDATGSVVVAVGDLIWGGRFEQASLTATTVTDNLGNSYSAINAGSDAGTSTARCYYSRVTVAGTLTAVHFAGTASSNNGVALAAVIEGPFVSSSLDANPANITNDVSTPFTCPATGTLTQSKEVVLCAFVSTGNVTLTATSPNLKAVQLNTSNILTAALGYQTVSSTSSVAPAWTSSGTPTDDVLLTASFKGDLTQTLTGTKYTDADSFGTDTVSTAITLAGTKYADPDSFGAATVSQGGPQTLTATKYADPDTFYSQGIATDYSTWKITETSGSQVRYCLKNVTGSDNTTYTLSCYAKSSNRAMTLAAQDNAGTNGAYVNINLTNGANSGFSYGGWSAPSSTFVTSVGDGWYYCTTDITVPAGTGSTWHGYFNVFGTDFVNPYIGDGSSYIEVSRFRIVPAGGGSTLLTPHVSLWDTITEVSVTVSTDELLTGTLYADPDTFGAASVSQGGGTQTLTGTKYSDPDTFGAPALSTGSVNLTATNYADPDAFGAASVSQSGSPQTLTAAKYTDPDAFGSPTISTGPVSLQATKYGDPDTFRNPAISVTVTLSGTKYTDPDSFYTPVVSEGAAPLTATKYTDADWFGAATVSLAGSPQSLTATKYADPDGFYSPTIGQGEIVPAPPQVIGSGGGGRFRGAWGPPRQTRPKKRRRKRGEPPPPVIEAPAPPPRPLPHMPSLVEITPPSAPVLPRLQRAMTAIATAAAEADDEDEIALLLSMDR